MKKYNAASAVPAMMVQLAAASWETIFYRSLMMVQGTCPISEFQRMGLEKAAAAQSAATAFMTGKGHAAVLAPYLRRARANARRLRKTA
jgi:hypothetical protein